MSKTIGLIGLGNMGRPMARALLRSGRPVVGFDNSADAIAGFTSDGGTAADDPSAVARAVETVIVMLPSSAVVESVVSQMLASGALGDGHRLIDMSSSEPLRTRALAERLRAVGVALVDAPVSGGVRRAESGTLTIMAGGEADDVRQVEPVLATMGTVIRVGPVGAGHAVKALNNLLSATHLLATAEAMLAGERFGLDPAVMLSVFNSSSGRSGSTESKWPDFVLTERYNSGFALALMVKDMRIAVDLMQAIGSPDDIGASAVQAWSRAAEQLPAGADHTEIANWVRAAVAPVEAGA